MKYDGVTFTVQFNYNQNDKNTYLKAYKLKRYLETLGANITLRGRFSRVCCD